MLEVLHIFTRLGLTSFGGPTAHLGYFRDEFVEKRKWLTDDEYADLVALCQFMPGPASSQVGMAIGLKRAGYGGMLAAFVGFTLPSVVLMVAFALGVARLGDISDAGWLAGLKAAAVAVVAQAVMGMAKSIVTDRLRAGVALAAFLIVLLVPHPAAQVGAIVAGMLVAAFALSPIDAPSAPSRTPAASRTVGVGALAVFAALLALLPLAGRMGTSWGIFDSFYRSGALVFGGGHVVLPLLEAETVQTGMLSQDEFLAGYGAAQALPGPLFTLATFLGAAADSAGLLGAIVATVAIFLPAGLLTAGALPFWEQLRTNLRARRALDGLNAGVVGILTAALITPVFTAGVLETGWIAAVIAAAGFAALQFGKVPAWAVVLGAAGIGWLVF